MRPIHTKDSQRRLIPLRKSQEVIGLSVIHLKTGTKLGEVKDILFDTQQQFCGLLLEDGGWLQRRRYIPKSNIQSIGRDAVVIHDQKQILPFHESTQEWTGLYSGRKRLKGQTVLSETGNELGVIENVYFMEEVGTLIGYELSDGWISDLTEGRKVLKTTEPLIWGKDVLIAHQEGVKVETQEVR